MIYRTIREVFPWAITVKAGRSNEIIIATKKPELEELDFSSFKKPKDSPRVRNMLSRLRKLDGYEKNKFLKSYSRRLYLEVPDWQNAELLTDDYAPVEMAWDLMALEFIK